jgi:hypothetical protein
VSSEREKTLEHIRAVQKNILIVAMCLIDRAIEHDQSKLEPPEAEIFERITPKLAGLTYGSEEYKATLEELGPTLKHHYEQNMHHPEHWDAGMMSMTLVDIVEMFCDWCAATLRHDNGSILKSIEINQKRFDYPEMLANIFRNSRYGMECK